MRLLFALCRPLSPGVCKPRCLWLLPPVSKAGHRRFEPGFGLRISRCGPVAERPQGLGFDVSTPVGRSDAQHVRASRATLKEHCGVELDPPARERKKRRNGSPFRDVPVGRSLPSVRNRPDRVERGQPQPARRMAASCERTACCRARRIEFCWAFDLPLRSGTTLEGIGDCSCRPDQPRPAREKGRAGRELEGFRQERPSRVRRRRGRWRLQSLVCKRAAQSPIAERVIARVHPNEGPPIGTSGVGRGSIRLTIWKVALSVGEPDGPSARSHRCA